MLTLPAIYLICQESADSTVLLLRHAAAMSVLRGKTTSKLDEVAEIS